MTPQEQDQVKDVLKFFYPNSPPIQNVTPELGDLAALMLKEALEGSKAMNFVPRPAGFMPGVGWLLSQAVQMFWRSQAKTKIYDVRAPDSCPQAPQRVRDGQAGPVMFAVTGSRSLNLRSRRPSSSARPEQSPSPSHQIWPEKSSGPDATGTYAARSKISDSALERI